jgi:hypothetical protein
VTDLFALNKMTEVRNNFNSGQDGMTKKRNVLILLYTMLLPDEPAQYVGAAH